MTRLLLLGVLSCLSVVAQADILTLRDGSRHHGEVVERGENHVLFRIRSADGRASVVRRFELREVAEIQRTREIEPPTTQPAEAPAQQLSRDTIVEQMLRESFELLDAGETSATRRALQRTVNEADDAQLVVLDRITRAARGAPLAELLADVRIEEALRGSPDRIFDLKRPTRYEREALSRRLTQLSDELLGRVHSGRRISDWARLREDYVQLHRDAPFMVREALLASMMIAARLEFDARLDRDSRAALAGLRGDLSRLVAQVRSMRGFTSIAPPAAGEDPTLAVAARLAEQLRSNVRQPESAPAPPRDPP